MKLPVGTIAVVMGSMLLFSGPAWSSEKEKKDEVKEAIDMAAAAKVTIDQAIKTASEKVAGTIVEAELERKHNKIVWEVEVLTADNKLMEVHIDAETGTVIDVEEEKPGKGKAMKREGKK